MSHMHKTETGHDRLLVQVGFSLTFIFSGSVYVLTEMVLSLRNDVRSTLGVM